MKALLDHVFWSRWLRGRVRAELRPHGKTLKALRKDVDRLEKSMGRTVGHLQRKQDALLQNHDKISSKLDSLALAQSDLLTAVKALSATDRKSNRQLESLERTARQLHLAKSIDYEQQSTVAGLAARLDATTLASHTRSAIDRATVEKEPFEHFVIEDLFPADFYELLIQALPPPGFWRPGQVGRENWTVGEDVGPTLTEAVWRFTNDVLTTDVLIPPLVAKMARFLEEHSRDALGLQAGAILDAGVHRSGGRLMLRRPGYCIQPHLDPSRAISTFLLYLARDGDSEDHGTKLYRVRQSLPDRHAGIFYAYEHDVDYEFAKLVPYRANTALVFLTQRGLHGADIPSDASPSTLERYTYQFYIGRPKPGRDAPRPGANTS